MKEKNISYWLALLHMVGMGPATIAMIYRRFSDLEELFKQPAALGVELGLTTELQKQIANPAWDKVERDLTWLEQPQHHILTLENELYPQLLREIPAAPPVLFVHGNPAVLNTPQIAMVGSRNSSANGNETAYEFARYLARAGYTITSGLALGIDAVSHRGALAQNAITVAVTGTGLDQVYPKQHAELAEQITVQGAIVSEFPLGTMPKPENFPRRNRIISGLSLAVLVVEAALRSGSLITARFALEQGREVLAIPGSIHNPLARGCHSLIRQGAKLVETADDILEELKPYQNEKPVQNDEKLHVTMPTSSIKLDSEYEKLLSSMGYEIVTVNNLVVRNGLSADIISSMLLILELQGIIKSVPGGFVRT